MVWTLHTMENGVDLFNKSTFRSRLAEQTYFPYPFCLHNSYSSPSTRKRKFPSSVSYKISHRHLEQNTWFQDQHQPESSLKEIYHHKQRDTGSRYISQYPQDLVSGIYHHKSFDTGSRYIS